MATPRQIVSGKEKFAIDDGSEHPDRNQFFRMGIMQGAEQSAIYQAEHGRGRADAEGQCQHCNASESWALAQLAQRVMNI